MYKYANPVRWRPSFPPRGIIPPWPKPPCGRCCCQTGAPVYDADGYLQKGVIVRHLALPGHTDDSFAVLALLARIRDEERAYAFHSQPDEPVHAVL